MTRVILLTSTLRRHRYVEARVAAELSLSAVWREEKSFVPQRYATNAGEHAVIAEHFAARDAAEHRFFGDPEAHNIEGLCVRCGAPGLVNDPDEIDRMAVLGPDVVLVFGTGLLRAPVIDRFSGRIINLHLGLSPYYRGSGTNFWPLVNREPEAVGATIHYLDLGIDTGPIISRVRPILAAADGPHDVGNNAIIAGAAALIDAARAHASGRGRAEPHARGGRLYQRKDFSADAVRRLYQQFETGMIAEYLADRAARDSRFPL